MILASNPPYPIFSDTDGDALDEGYIWIGPANQNPQTTQVAVYWDAAGTLPATQPIRTIGGYVVRSGSPANFYVSGDCSMSVLDKRGRLIYYAPNSAANSYQLSLSSTTDSAKGAALIGYKPTWAGSIGRTVSSKLSDWVSVKDFGAMGDGATNDAAAFQAAIDYCNSIGGGTVLVPAGNYIISALLNMKRFVKIFGEGMDTTVLKPTVTGNLFSIDLTALAPFPGFPDASVGWEGFTIDCGTLTGVTGMSARQCRYTYVHKVKFKGCATNVYIDRGSDHSLMTLYSEGTSTLKAGGFICTSTDDADYCYMVHMSDVFFHNNYTTGTAANLIYMRRCALGLVNHVTVNDAWQGNTTASNGIVLENDCQGCKFTDIVFAAVNVGIWLQAGTGPAVGPSYCTFTNCDMDQARANSMIVDRASYCSFIACRFSSSAVLNTITSVVVRNNSGVCVFLNCQVDGYNGVGGTAMDITGCSGIRMQGCLFTTLYNGIFIGPATTSIAIESNIFTNVSNTPIAGTISQTGNYVKNNTGHRLTTNLAPAVPATTVAATNNTGYAVTAYLSGGTFTVVAVNGIFTNVTAGYRLEVGDSIAVTYSAAPTWNWVPSWG